jgi:hypothetical protein
MNTLASTREAWDQLGEKVDSLVKALIEETNVPGMTVAVTKRGAASPVKGLRLCSCGRNEKATDETVLAQ